MMSRTYLLGGGSLLGSGLLSSNLLGSSGLLGVGGGSLLLDLGLGGELDLARRALGEDEALLLGTTGDGLVNAGVEAGLGALGGLGVVRLDVLLDGGTADTSTGVSGVSKDGLLDHGLMNATRQANRNEKE